MKLRFTALLLAALGLGGCSLLTLSAAPITPDPAIVDDSPEPAPAPEGWLGWLLLGLAGVGGGAATMYRLRKKN